MVKGCSVKCAAEFPHLYGLYIAALQALKGGGHIRDFGHCHGLVNERESLVRELSKNVKEEVARAFIERMSITCLKCGCDEIFG